MADLQKCIYLTDGEQCDQDALHDGLCGTHIVATEENVRLQAEIRQLLLDLGDQHSVSDTATEIMKRIISPTLDRLWDLEIAHARNARLSARARSNAVRDKLVAQAMARKASENEERLRSDFADLAKDLKAVIRHVAPPLGGVQHPQHGRWLMELHSWCATAEILADKELSDNLDEVRKAPIEEFGEVPRPEWRCHIHPDLEPMTRLNGTKICSEGMCIQGEGD